MRKIYWSFNKIVILFERKTNSVLIVPRDNGISRDNGWTGDSWLEFNIEKRKVFFTRSKGWHRHKITIDAALERAKETIAQNE